MAPFKVLTTSFIAVSLSGCQIWQRTSLDNLPPSAAISSTSQPGIVQAWYWEGIGGSSVSDLTSSPQFPTKPDRIEDLTRLISPSENIGDNYGRLVRGFIIPKSDGNYRFFLSGDDETQLWLSSSESELDAKQIASVPGWTTAQDYTKYASQQSGLIALKANTRYFFKVLQKEATGGDHFSVAWEGPSINQSIIDSVYLASYIPPLYPMDDKSISGFELGYRVGFVDGSNGLPFNPEYPPLDQDRDALYDNWEILNGLDPNDPNDASSDPDNDLLYASDEFRIGTKENNPDTDSDGIPDAVEYAYNLDPLDSSDANGDLDSDGISNLEEYNAGTALDEPNKTVNENPNYIPGFVAQLFDGKNFDTYKGYRVDNTIDFNWGRKAPDPSLGSDNFSIRWTGLFTAPHTNGDHEYRFVTHTNDGARLYLGQELVIDRWIDQGATSYAHNLILTPGQQIPITFEYYDNIGLAVAQFSITDRTSGQSISLNTTVVSPDPALQATLDSDTDGIPDTWELLYGLSPWLDDAQGISNTSGVTNYEAFQRSVNPWTLEQIDTGKNSASTTDQTTTVNGSGSSVTLSWSAPLVRADGTSIAPGEIQSYRINYGQDLQSLVETQMVAGTETNTTITGLNSGTWYFEVTAIDTDGRESAPSKAVSYSIP